MATLVQMRHFFSKFLRKKDKIFLESIAHLVPVESLRALADNGFTGSNISAINGYKRNSTLVDIIIQLSACTNAIKELASIGIKTEDIVFLLHAASDSVEKAMSSLSSPEIMERLKAMLAHPDTEVKVSGESTNGLGFDIPNLLHVFGGSGATLNYALEKLLDPRRWKRFVVILSPESKEFTLEGNKINGFGFKASDMSKIFSSTGLRTNYSFSSLTSIQEWDIFAAFMAPTSRKVIIEKTEVNGLGFKAKNMVEILSGTKGNFQESLMVLFNPQAFYIFSALLSDASCKFIISKRLLNGFGFTKQNLSTILGGSVVGLNKMIRILTLHENVYRLHVLLSPTNESFVLSGEEVNGFGFTTQNFSSMFANAGAHSCPLLAYMITNLHWNYTSPFFGPVNGKPTGKVLFNNIGFNAADFSGIVSASKVNALESVKLLLSPDNWERVNALFAPTTEAVSVNKKYMWGLGLTSESLFRILRNANINAPGAIRQLVTDENWDRVAVLFTSKTRKVEVDSREVRGLGLDINKLPMILESCRTGVSSALSHMLSAKNWNRVSILMTDCLDKVWVNNEFVKGLGFNAECLLRVFSQTNKNAEFILEQLFSLTFWPAITRLLIPKGEMFCAATEWVVGLGVSPEKFSETLCNSKQSFDDTVVALTTSYRDCLLQNSGTVIKDNTEVNRLTDNVALSRPIANIEMSHFLGTASSEKLNYPTNPINKELDRPLSNMQLDPFAYLTDAGLNSSVNNAGLNSSVDNSRLNRPTSLVITGLNSRGGLRDSRPVDNAGLNSVDNVELNRPTSLVATGTDSPAGTLRDNCPVDNAKLGRPTDKAELNHPIKSTSIGLNYPVDTAELDRFASSIGMKLNRTVDSSGLDRPLDNMWLNCFANLAGTELSRHENNADKNNAGNNAGLNCSLNSAETVSSCPVDNAEQKPASSTHWKKLMCRNASHSPSGLTSYSSNTQNDSSETSYPAKRRMNPSRGDSPVSKKKLPNILPMFFTP